jgi:hypothetical protein
MFARAGSKVPYICDVGAAHSLTNLSHGSSQSTLHIEVRQSSQTFKRRLHVF